jgi:hypothetical protein
VSPKLRRWLAVQVRLKPASPRLHQVLRVLRVRLQPAGRARVRLEQAWPGLRRVLRVCLQSAGRVRVRLKRVWPGLRRVLRVRLEQARWL